MSFQLISTYIIIFFAFGYTFYQFLQLFLKQKSSCGGGCGGCDFKKELNKRNVPPKIFTKTDKLTYIK